MARILVIDDDNEIRVLFQVLLEREGHEVLLAANGMEGVQLYEKNSVDLIITDIIMPRQEGIETIRALKTKNPEVKIIAMSGGGRAEPTEYLKMAHVFGAEKVFKKPFSRLEILSAIKEMLDS